MTDNEAYEFLVDVGSVVDAVRVVAKFNKPMAQLAKTLADRTPVSSALRDKVQDAVRNGSTFFEALTKEEPILANACHDFVYQIANPLASVISKNLAREEACKTILSIT